MTRTPVSNRNTVTRNKVIPVMFARAGYGYNEDGDQYNDTIPRLDRTKGVLIEEPLINMARYDQSMRTGGYYKNTSTSVVTYESTEKLYKNFTTSVKVECPGDNVLEGCYLTPPITTDRTRVTYAPNSQAFSLKVPLWIPTGMTLRITGINDVYQTINGNNDWQIVEDHGTELDTSTRFYFETLPKHTGTFYIGPLMGDDRLYSTSWYPGVQDIAGVPTYNTRNAETLYIKPSWINPSSGTIDITLTVNTALLDQTEKRYIIDIEGTGYIQLYHDNASDVFKLETSNGTAISTVTSEAVTEGSHKFTIEYGTTLTLKIDDVSVGTPVSNPKLPTTINNISIGHNVDKTGYCNTYFNTINIDGNKITKFKETNRGITTGLKTYPVSTGASNYEAWPSICQLNDGTLISCYRTADANQHGYHSTGQMVIRKSTDHGKTWGEEITAAKYGTNLDNRNGAINSFTIDGVETLMCIFSTMSGDVTPVWNIYTTRSTDRGDTWDVPVLVKDSGSSQCKPILLSNGDLAVVVYDEASDYSLYCMVSSDNGDSWTEYYIAKDNTNKLTETAITEKDGDVLVVARTDAGSYYQKIRSDDYGRTWGTPELETNLNYYKGVKCELNRLENDTILLTYTDCFMNTTIVKSVDEGETWTNLTVVSTGYRFSTYPDTILLDNDQIATIWCTNSTTSDVYVTICDKSIMNI